MPIATACFWLVTFLPLRPECSLPSPYSCITLLILFCAFLPYFRPEDFLLLLDEDELFLLLDERFFVAIFPPFQIPSLSEPSRLFCAPSIIRLRSPVCGS